MSLLDIPEASDLHPQLNLNTLDNVTFNTSTLLTLYYLTKDSTSHFNCRMFTKTAEEPL